MGRATGGAALRPSADVGLKAAPLAAGAVRVQQRRGAVRLYTGLSEPTCFSCQGLPLFDCEMLLLCL